MGKNKLKKFAEIEKMAHVFQFPFSRLETEGFPLRGNWNREFFGNDNPIIVEIGCGRGEYTVGLARRFPDCNFIGIDIKGARIHAGAKQSLAEGLKNVAFVRTNVELLHFFFAPGEVDELWITFPDPQMKKPRRRLTSTLFLNTYRKVLRPDGVINLKTDSPFLHTYTKRLVALNDLTIKADIADIYNTPGALTDILSIRTHYEAQWIDRGLTIKYLAFNLPAEKPLEEPKEDDIPLDTYRSYGRNYNTKTATEYDTIP